MIKKILLLSSISIGLSLSALTVVSCSKKDEVEQKETNQLKEISLRDWLTNFPMVMNKNKEINDDLDISGILYENRDYNRLQERLDNVINFLQRPIKVEKEWSEKQRVNILGATKDLNEHFLKYFIKTKSVQKEDDSQESLEKYYRTIQLYWHTGYTNEVMDTETKYYIKQLLLALGPDLVKEYAPSENLRDLFYER